MIDEDDEPGFDDFDPDDDGSDYECEACDGTGWVALGQADGSGELAMECPECGGVEP